MAVIVAVPAPFYLSTGKTQNPRHKNTYILNERKGVLSNSLFELSEELPVFLSVSLFYKVVFELLMCSLVISLQKRSVTFIQVQMIDK